MKGHRRKVASRAGKSETWSGKTERQAGDTASHFGITEGNYGAMEADGGKTEGDEGRMEAQPENIEHGWANVEAQRGNAVVDRANMGSQRGKTEANCVNMEVQPEDTEADWAHIEAQTDVGGFRWTGKDGIHQSKELEYYVQWSMTTKQAIQSATLVAAELLGQAANLGMATAGRYADIIAMVGDPLQDITELQRVRFVMTGGVVYVRPQ